jgi:epoxyqueuosine reductase QueG
MDDLSALFKEELLCHGADLVGFGDLSGVPPEVREHLPVGVSIAVKYPKDVIRSIAELPTPVYCNHYHRLNEKLDGLVTMGAELLHAMSYQAIAQTREHVGYGEAEDRTALPHKTVATRAGLGWIGKCALLVTKQYGSMIRLSSILTDAPLKVARPINKSYCGACTVCKEACPAHAVSGSLWSVDVRRDEFFNAAACRRTARERSWLALKTEITICGRCIAVCPYTKQYLERIDT